MTAAEQSGVAVARALLHAGCATARTDEPFRLPSGWTTPVYMDCRRITAFPTLRRYLLAQAVERIRSSGCLDGVTGIVGGESSGIALAAWLAEKLELPLHFARKRGSGGNPIAGALVPGDRVLLVDDLMAAGLSKVRFIDAIRAEGAEVTELFVIFDYATFGADALVNVCRVRTHALATWSDVALAAQRLNFFPAHVQAELERFLAAPAAWSLAHGGRGESPSNKEI